VPGMRSAYSWPRSICRNGVRRKNCNGTMNPLPQTDNRGHAQESKQACLCSPRVPHLLCQGFEGGPDSGGLLLMALPHQLQREHTGRLPLQLLSHGVQRAAAACGGRETTADCEYAPFKISANTILTPAISLCCVLSPTSVSHDFLCSSSMRRRRAPKPGSGPAASEERSAAAKVLKKYCSSEQELELVQAVPSRSTFNRYYPP
jgi:hypothetical protein